MRIDSARFDDGTYHFQVVGWQDGGGQTLVNPRVLDVCGTEIDNGWVLTFDNRLDPDPAHPTGPTHPCGDDTVHLCLTEPDTDFIAVRVNGVTVNPCQVVDAAEGVLEIDFLVHDPDGHLGEYTLEAHFAENESRDLLHQPSSVLTTLSADSVGPTYGEALGQFSAAPTCTGGKLRLTVDAAEAFPVPCCYELKLRAVKRTVVSCGQPDYYNDSHYTIGVGVCGPVLERQTPG